MPDFTLGPERPASTYGRSTPPSGPGVAPSTTQRWPSARCRSSCQRARRQVGIIGSSRDWPRARRRLRSCRAFSRTMSAEEGLALWGYGLSGFASPAVLRRRVAASACSIGSARASARHPRHRRRRPPRLGVNKAMDKGAVAGLVLAAGILCGRDRSGGLTREYQASSCSQWSGNRFGLRPRAGSTSGLLPEHAGVERPLAWRGLDGRFRAYLLMP